MGNIKLFESKQIRTVWNEEDQKWYFVVEDVIALLTDSSDPKQYIKRMRQRDEELAKGWVQIVPTLAIDTAGGKQKMGCASGPEKPYHLRKYGMSEKGTYIRVGSAAEPMQTKMIEKLFARRTRNSIGRIKSNEQYLKFEQLKIYYQESGKKLNNQFASNLGLLTANSVYNYAAYLMADVNNISIKVAKYSGINRVNLIENNEYGYCSLVKATKLVLDKLELENKTRSRITSQKRIDTRLWNVIALREAVINAIVHNDYTREVPPKFEIFADRIEITSTGGLPEDLSREEFFQGFSVPRNQEIMRIFKDLEMVEHLGSGVPRILENYGRRCFKFSENFLRMAFPATEQVTEQVRKLLLSMEKGEYTTSEIMEILQLKHRPTVLLYKTCIGIKAHSDDHTRKTAKPFTKISPDKRRIIVQESN